MQLAPVVSFFFAESVCSPTPKFVLGMYTLLRRVECDESAVSEDAGLGYQREFQQKPSGSATDLALLSCVFNSCFSRSKCQCHGGLITLPPISLPEHSPPVCIIWNITKILSIAIVAYVVI